MPLALRAFFHGAVEILLVDAFALVSAVHIFQAIEAEHLEVSERIVPFEVEQLVATLLELDAHPDDSRGVPMVHPQMVEQGDGPLTVPGSLNRRVAHVQRVLAEPTTAVHSGESLTSI